MRRFFAALLALALSLPVEAGAAAVVSFRVPMGGSPAAASAGAAAAARGPGRSLPLEFSLGAFEIGPVYESASRELVVKLDAVANIPPGSETFEGTVLAVERAYADFAEATRPLFFLSSVSPDPAVRGAVEAVRRRSGRLWAEQSARPDVYKAVEAYAKRGEELGKDDQRLLDDMLRDYTLAGLGLSEERQRRLEKINVRLSELEAAFQRNLQEWDDALAVFPEELKGLPKSFIGRLERIPDGRVLVPVDKESYGKVMRQAVNPGLRRRLYYRKQKEAAKENLPILKKALTLRHEKARLLGYRNFAELALEGRMAKTPKQVWRFLQRLRRLLIGAAGPEREEVLERKRRDKPKAEKLYPWDTAYYGSKLFKERLNLEPKRTRAYFPLSHVLAESLKIYEELLGIRFEPVTVEVWHPEVRAYDIRDAASGERLARVYLDLFARPGKRGGAAAFTLVSGRELPDGGYREPVSAVSASFHNPAPGRPALLYHHEVKTLFHELGHVMHQTLTAARHWRFASSAVARDFVEGPSQMMENFIWKPEVLKRLSGHYQDPTRKLPRALLDKLLATRSYHAAGAALSQAALAAMDLAFHSAAPKDVLKVYRRVRKFFTGEEPDHASRFPARFRHGMRGYSAGYYGYLWSRVFAQDIFSEFEAGGLISAEVGSRYRSIILENGGSVDADELLRRFLGREPDERAFLRWLGVEPSA